MISGSQAVPDASRFEKRLGVAPCWCSCCTLASGGGCGCSCGGGGAGARCSRSGAAFASCASCKGTDCAEANGMPPNTTTNKAIEKHQTIVVLMKPTPASPGDANVALQSRTPRLPSHQRDGQMPADQIRSGVSDLDGALRGLVNASDGRAPALLWTTAGNGASLIRGPYESCGAALAASGISLSCPHTWAPFATVGASEVCAPWQECCPAAGDCASRDAHAIPHAVSAAGAEATASTSRHAPMRRLISMSIRAQGPLHICGPQSQRVADYRHRAEAHGRGGNHR